MTSDPLRLNKKDFQPFLKELAKDHDLFAPVRLAEGVSVYRKIDPADEIDLDASNPQKPVKEVFFPQSEAMLRFEKVENRHKVTSTDEVKKPRVVLGARACDIQALSLLDDVFLGKEYTDVYFLKKRQSTALVGFACNHPLSTCFCASTGGGPFAREGSDLFFIDMGDAYLVEPLTDKGKALTRSTLFVKANPKDIAFASDLEKKAVKKGDASIPVEGIEKKLDQLMESRFWDRIHEKCIGCGVCTFLCPTCHCFDIVDEAVNEQGQRVRNWDTCLSSLYSLETSGHNPRPTGRERTRQRVMHKFNYFPKNFKKIACVGCGRCILYCPVNFDIRQVIQDAQKGEVSTSP
jgi:sulfhydrogenase subunit beta (sulfur reductase)